MPVELLSAKRVKALRCDPGQRKRTIWDSGCKNLMLEVRASGGKTYYLRYHDSRGQQRQLRIGDAADLSLEQARKQADALRGQIALGIDPGEVKATLKQVPTFAAFVNERYLPYAKGYKRSWTTDASLLRNHLLPRFGSMFLDQITKHDIVAMHHARRAEGAAPGSANRLLILTRYIFNLALKWEIPGLVKNPTAGVPLFEENNQRERYLTPEEARRLYVAIEASGALALKFIIPLLILTGARKREVLDARWADFDLDQRSWRIPISKSGKARHVPLSDGVLRVLDAIRAEQATWPVPLRDTPWVVPNPRTGKPFVTTFGSWDRVRQKAGLPDLRIHDLRHSFASFLVNGGRSLYEVQKILGHTQIKTTQRYAHLSQDTLVDAANSAMQALGTTFLPPLPPPST